MEDNFQPSNAAAERGDRLGPLQQALKMQNNFYDERGSINLYGFPNCVWNLVLSKTF
jgi:hypothetical protein